MLPLRRSRQAPRPVPGQDLAVSLRGTNDDGRGILRHIQSSPRHHHGIACCHRPQRPWCVRCWMSFDVPDPDLTPDQMVARAVALRSALRDEQAEDGGPQPVLAGDAEAFTDAGFYRILQPRDVRRLRVRSEDLLPHDHRDRQGMPVVGLAAVPRFRSRPATRLVVLAAGPGGDLRARWALHRASQRRQRARRSTGRSRRGWVPHQRQVALRVGRSLQHPLHGVGRGRRRRPGRDAAGGRCPATSTRCWRTGATSSV